MGVLSAIVLFAVIWFLTLFCVLPVRLETQGDRGQIEPGTHSGSPANPQMKKRFLITTGIALVVWGGLVAVILSGVITVENMDFFNRMN